MKFFTYLVAINNRMKIDLFESASNVFFLKKSNLHIASFKKSTACEKTDGEM